MNVYPTCIPTYIMSSQLSATIEVRLTTLAVALFSHRLRYTPSSFTNLTVTSFSVIYYAIQLCPFQSSITLYPSAFTTDSYVLFSHPLRYTPSSFTTLTVTSFSAIHHTIPILIHNSLCYHFYSVILIARLQKVLHQVAHSKLLGK